MGADPYALFGGYNSEQVVGGKAGIKSFETNPGNFKSSIRSWAIDNKDFMYGGQSLKPAGS